MMQYTNLAARSITTACAAATLLAVHLLATPPAHAQQFGAFDRGSPFPLSCEPCSTPVPDNTVRLFEDYHFRGEYVDLRIDAAPPNEMLTLGRTSLRSRASSARWNLPPGVLMLLYETGSWLDHGPGRQYAIWGHGQIISLRDVDFNDQAQAWAWFYIGAESRRHICTPQCHDHYYDGERMIYIKGDHRHGPGCGHSWNGTYWVRSAIVPPPPVHVCTRQCDEHYFDGERLVTIRGHRHGPNCGHLWNGRHWVPTADRPDWRDRGDRDDRPDWDDHRDRDDDRGGDDRRDRDDHADRRDGPDRHDGLDSGHICTPNCANHVYDGNKIVVIPGHRHGRNCGHTWNGRHWVDTRDELGPSHVCSRRCTDHYFDGERYIVIKGHRHGPNCGHRWNGKYWIAVK